MSRKLYNSTVKIMSKFSKYRPVCICIWCEFTISENSLYGDTQGRNQYHECKVLISEIRFNDKLNFFSVGDAVDGALYRDGNGFATMEEGMSSSQFLSDTSVDVYTFDDFSTPWKHVSWKYIFRMRTIFVAPMTGAHRFVVAVDNAVKLYISKTSSKAEDKEEVLSLAAVTGYQVFDKYVFL